MEGLKPINSLTQSAIEKILERLYKPKMYDLNSFEDVILFTNRRTEFSNIGADCIKFSHMLYLIENIYWINVCLFVNSDFRACFEDAITIEKALLMVNDQDYEDFRDEMTLDEPDATDQTVNIDLASYNDKMEMAIIHRMDKCRQDFYQAGMTDVYDDLIATFEEKTALEITYIIHNIIYVINAFNRNGVFKRYVMLVVDSVKKQLS